MVNYYETIRNQHLIGKKYNKSVKFYRSIYTIVKNDGTQPNSLIDSHPTADDFIQQFQMISSTAKTILTNNKTENAISNSISNKTDFSLLPTLSSSPISFCVDSCNIDQKQIKVKLLSNYCEYESNSVIV